MRPASLARLRASELRDKGNAAGALALERLAKELTDLAAAEITENLRAVQCPRCNAPIWVRRDKGTGPNGTR